MISLMDYRTCRYISVDEKHIQSVTEGYESIGARTYPYSDVIMYNPETKHQKIIRVVESARKIGSLIINAITEQNQGGQ